MYAVAASKHLGTAIPAPRPPTPAPARVSTHINKKEMKSSAELGKKHTRPAMKLKGAV